MSRADYWNKDYWEYWLRRTQEAERTQGESALVAGDRATVGNSVLGEILAGLDIQPGHRVLELGCGFGRLFPILLEWTPEVYGSDISEVMVGEARKAYGGRVRELRVEEAERSSFPSDFFDRIVCCGVFDATEQPAALREILRLLKPAGVAVVTGKNSRYEPSDELALVAEENARKKGHPNFFTDYSALRAQLLARGVSVLTERFYRRRGDFAEARFVSECREPFYEYAVTFGKAGYDGRAFTEFSSAYSRTWQELRPAGQAQTGVALG